MQGKSAESKRLVGTSWAQFSDLLRLVGNYSCTFTGLQEANSLKKKLRISDRAVLGLGPLKVEPQTQEHANVRRPPGLMFK